jgi:hypothetical protein
MSYPPGPPNDGEPTPDQPEAAPGNQPPPEEQQPGPPPGYGQQGYGQPGYGGYPPQYGYGQPPATNGKATAALITGISSLVLFWCCGLGVAGVVAIVLGIKARTEIRRAGGAQSGDGMALAGIVTGAVAVLLGLLFLALVIYAIASGNADYNIDYGDDGSSF